MKLALFGGTFDPPHLGHIAVARAAVRRFKLDEVWFVPADVPPHKQKQPVTPYVHRYAMTALACAEDKRFVPSTIEAASDGRPSYTLETVRRVKAGLRASDQLFVIVGADMWATVATWWHAEELLREAAFIVVSRPGLGIAEIPGAKLHVLSTVRVPISATQVRAAARAGKALGKLVPGGVADYIKKSALYR